MHSGHLEIWECRHISQYLPLELCMTSKQTAQILSHNRDSLTACGNVDRVRCFILNPVREQRATCGDGQEVWKQCHRSLKMTTMYLCPFLSPTTINVCHVNATVSRKNVDMDMQPKITSIPERSIWSTAESTLNDRWWSWCGCSSWRYYHPGFH